jgi:hypothetical protein
MPSAVWPLPVPRLLAATNASSPYSYSGAVPANREPAQPQSQFPGRIRAGIAGSRDLELPGARGIPHIGLPLDAAAALSTAFCFATGTVTGGGRPRGRRRRARAPAGPGLHWQPGALKRPLAAGAAGPGLTCPPGSALRKAAGATRWRGRGCAEPDRDAGARVRVAHAAVGPPANAQRQPQRPSTMRATPRKPRDLRAPGAPPSRRDIIRLGSAG